MKTNRDWAGAFMIMADRMLRCESEEQMYQKLHSFKEEFNSEYGRLSRAKRNKNGFGVEDIND